MTMRQFARACVASLRRMKAESEAAHDARVHQAWMTAALSHGTKGLPKLETLLIRKPPTRKQTAQEQVAMWQTFAALVGGEFKPVEQH